MKKRLLSWLLVLTMVISLIPSTLVTTAFAADNISAQASGQAGKTKVELTNDWPKDLSADITDVTVTNTIGPGSTLTVGSGKTLIFHGSGFISNGTANQTLVIVEEGGHLVLDDVTIQNNAVGSNGAIYVKSGGLLDLGYNDQKERRAPSITSNKFNSAAKNLVIEDGATVRLNAAADKAIGVSYYKDGIDVGPFIAISGGRYTMRGTQEGNINSEAITSDNTAKWKLAYSYDNLIMTNTRSRVLVWDATDFWSYEDTPNHRNKVYSTIQHVDRKGYDVKLIRGGKNSPKHLTAEEMANLQQYDLIVFDCPNVDITGEERTAYLNYLNNGGRILFSVENAMSKGILRDTMNATASTIAHSLGGQFTAHAGEYVAGGTRGKTHTSPERVKELTKNMSTSWDINVGAYITSSSQKVYPLVTATTTRKNTSYVICDQDAGNRDGSQWGALTIIGDVDLFYSSYNNGANTGGNFIKNLVENTVIRRISAAAGVNPNSEFNEWQATTTTATNYRTPYAALQKAVENNTITLLTESRKDTGLTPTRDELLFEQSTLAYEQGSQYDGSTIHADTAGVYLDITKTGEVNLYSGTVTVTPKDATYPLVLNGTMDQDGTAITGGYKITASNKYTLDADDETSKIPAAQGGGASITLENIGDSVTVEYGAPINKTVTYKAQEAGEKIYLGYYRVDKNVGSNVTWTDADYAWHGQTFTTTAAGNAGWELNGEQLTVADKEGRVVGNYTLTKTGTETDGGNSWTVYTSKETGRDGTPKVTVKQQHLGGDADRNGEIKVIVSDVRGDVTIAAAGDVVSASAAFVYVVGVGRKNGAETQLWEYTTVRNSKDGLTQKPINGWPWEKWKAVEAGSALGGQTDYQNKTDKFNNSFVKDPTKLDTTNATAKYTIDLTQGDQVVVFYYDWNMVNVTIKATDANGNPIPDYTDQVVEYEIDKQTTITAPNLIGYQPVNGQNTKDITPAKDGDNTVSFVYEKTTGNLIYKAVYVDGAGVTHDLGTFSGGTLVKEQAPNKSAQAAPTFDNYELVNATADGTATSNGDATKFDGTNDITVTYQYQPKTKDIAVYAYVDDENGQILNLDKTSYKGITTGQSITITAPEIAGYKVKGDASKTFFITNNKTENQDVKFFYEKDNANDAYVLVKLVDSSNGDKLISSYQVPGVKDKAQLIKAPAAPYGYKADPTYNNEDKTVSPTGTTAPFTAEVVFKYVPHVHTVNVVLKDKLNNTNLTVNNFKDTYQVVDGESLKITAPSIYGYTMAASAEAVKELTNITKDETVTFEYEPIDKQLVTVHVKGVGPDGKTLFESRETVTHGTASKEVTVFTLPGLKLASAMVGTEDKIADVANGKLNVSLTGVAKGGTVDVVLNYESNMANVTVKAMYNGKELQSYTTSLEKDVQATINAPSVPGYTAKEQNKHLTPNGDTEVEFIYTKDNGNITIIVTADGTELYRKDGGTVANGSKITLTGSAAAPTVEYYTTPTAPKSVLVNGTEVKDDLTTYEYDGVGDIIVTYEYTRKTQDVTIIKKNVATGAKIDEQQLPGLEVGKSRTFTDGSVTVPSNYEAVADRNPTSYFVEDKAGQTVTFWYKNTSADQYAQVKVNLICGGKVFQSYPVTAIKGQPTTIQAPTWTGYELKAGTKASETVTPNGTPDNDKVEFEYTIKNPKTVTVVLKDNSNSTNPKLNAPANYIDSYTLKMGDNVTIWAPSIDGYSLVSATLGDKASDNKQMVQAEYGKLADGTTTVTFAYMPVSQANFVTHTVRFMLGDKELYSYDKKVDKGTGNVVSYPADAVKSMIPGYTYDHTSYLINGVTVQAGDVKDNVNATIIYHFAEDTARITIKFQDASGNELMQNGVKVPDQELTGYRKGQTVQVAAPVKEGFALVGDLIQEVTLNDANTDVAFKYAAAGDVTFTLKELNADGTKGSIIAVINGEASKTYDANAKDGNPLDLSQYGYTYEPSNLATEPFKAGNSGKVENPDMSKKTAYTVFYTKNLITVEFIPVNKTELDKANKNLNTAIADGTAYTTYKITELHPDTPEKARVGETYKAVAQSFNGWALKDSYSKQYKVEAGDTSLKVYFLYEQKTTGTVTVHYHFGTGADNMGEKLNEYTITAVAGEKLKISAPEYLLDNKYHLRTTNTNPCILTVTENTETVDFYYEANFVTITTKVNLDGTDTGTHETYEVIKNINITPNSGSTTLYPPEKAGYTLIGITADGATLTNGGADKLPTQYTNNKLDLKGLTTDATVTYYYKTTKASEYQTELTVEYKYNGYDLATAKKINANTGEANSIDIPAFDGYKASTYDFKDGSKAPVTGAGISGTTVSVTPAEKTATLTITYTRPDGSIVLPGKGDKIGDSDDIIVKPTDPNTPPTLNPDNGSVTIPKDPAGNTGTVTRPKDPTKPTDGKEDIIVPGGTTIDKDGTIHLPDNGGTINPGDKFPGATPADYISVVYKANGGTGDDVIDLIKNDQTTINARTNPFTNGSQTFTGWNTAGNGVGGTAYGENAPITIPNNSNTITLYAQWGKAEYKHTAKITYQANDGVTNAIEDTVGANDSTNFSINLRSNPFSVSGWDFGGWNTEANGTGTLKAANAVVEATANIDQTWYAQWYKVGANGSITVPGDGNPNTTGNNVTANGNGVTRDPGTGNISIPAGGNVVKGNETIALPNGGTLKPDGTLIIDKPNGGQIEVKPDGSTDNADVVVLTYEANNGTNDTRKVYATKGEAIAPLAADTFSYNGHAFLYWKSGDTIFKTNGTIIPTDAMTLSAVWAKVNPDGSMELPGKDGELEAPKDKDNVIVTPDKPNGTLDGPKDDGSVEVKRDEATVTRPDPQNPGKKEDIKVPEGTVVEPDGTIKLPDGTVINPDKRVPDDVTPTDYFVVTYEPGDGSGDVIRDVITKNADTTLRDEDTFTAPNGKIFDGWLDGAQTKHDAGDTLTVSESMTFTAQWKDKNPDTTVYPVTITYHSGNDTKTQRETGNSKQFSATLNANSFTAPAADWTFMGWTTDANGGKNGTFYKDGGTIALDVTNPDPDLYAVWYHKDDTTGTITLPGKDNDPTTADNNVTVNPGTGTAPTVKNDSNEGYIEANGGNTVQQPAGTITVIDGPVKVYPDGTVFVPAGSKVTDKDGNEVTGPATIDPDGKVEPGKKDDPKKDDTDNSIIIPGKDGFIDPPHDKDNLIVKPDGNGNQTGSIDNSTGDTTITAPDGADVSIPGKNPPDTRADIKLPQGTVIKPDGTIILPDDKNGKDENGGTIPGGSEIDPDGVVTYRYTVVYLDSSNNALRAPTFLKLKAGDTGNVTAPEITGYTISGSATKTVEAKAGDTYTVTFIYTKNSTGGGSSSGGGDSSTVSSYTIKASAGNGGIISPSGNVSVKRGDDQTFVINPVNGYRIADVIVDGKSVGAVSLYTFENVRANHTIEVVFTKLNSIVADPTETGVAGWLQTREHIAYLGGYGNGLFGPNDNMTRAQVAQMFYNLLLEKDIPVTTSFSDVPADAWYAKAVNTLASLGIIKGIGNDQFAPNRTITRAEFTVIAMRFANVSATVTNPFSDIASSDWYYTAVTSAVSYGWITGYSDGTFKPMATITRAEVATIVNRMLARTADRNFVDSSAVTRFDDVPATYWAYYNIAEATTAHTHAIDNDGVESWGRLM